jgi:hypothetical protein
MPTPGFLRRALAAAAAIGLALTTWAASAPAQPPAEPLTDEQKVALQALDADLERLDVLLERITEAQHKATTKGYIDKFKETRNALHQKFDQGKYDEVKFETQAEFQRIHSWLAPGLTPKPNPATDTSRVVVYLLEPEPSDPADVKVALAALANELGRLEKRNAQRSAGNVRDAEKKQLALFRARHGELGRKFSRPGWETLLAEMKTIAEERDLTIWPPAPHPLHPAAP